jgi:hypothetical protein
VTLTPEVLPSTVTANYLLYGPPKNGKTAGAMTAPGSVCYLNADLPGRVRFGKSRDKDDRVKVFQLPEGKVLETLIEVQNQAQQEGSWDTVVIDPVGDLYTRLLLDLSRKAMRPTLPTRGDVSTYLERWCRAMCENPRVNFVIVCHEYGYVRRVELPIREDSDETEVQYVAQLRDGKGRRGGDGFDVLATEEKPYRDLNLTDWAAEIAAAYDDAPKAQEEAVAA